MRAGAGDRSALYPLHLGHHRHPQRRGARQWRASGRAEMVDVQSLRRQARRGLVVRLRYRLGGRPQLHRLRPAVSRRDHGHVRGQADRHARTARRVLAGGFRNTRRSPSSPRRPRSARISKEDPEGKSIRQYDRPVEIPHAVPGRSEARRSADGGMGGDPVAPAGDRPLVADRNRRVHRRQSGRLGPVAGETRLADGADAWLPGRHGR